MPRSTSCHAAGCVLLTCACTVSIGGGTWWCCSSGQQHSFNGALFCRMYVHLQRLCHDWWQNHTHRCWPPGLLPAPQLAPTPSAGLLPTQHLHVRNAWLCLPHTAHTTVTAREATPSKPNPMQTTRKRLRQRIPWLRNPTCSTGMLLGPRLQRPRGTRC
jgi:hypothetical protein